MYLNALRNYYIAYCSDQTLNEVNVSEVQNQGFVQDAEAEQECAIKYYINMADLFDARFILKYAFNNPPED